MKWLRLIVAPSLLGLTSLANANSLADIAAFAEKICQNTVEGNITRTTLSGNLKGDAAGLAKALGLSISAEGKIVRGTEEYKGIPLEKLPKEIPTPAQCKADMAKILIQERKDLASKKN